MTLVSQFVMLPLGFLIKVDNRDCGVQFIVLFVALCSQSIQTIIDSDTVEDQTFLFSTVFLSLWACMYLHINIEMS